MSEEKSVVATYLLWFFFGTVGIHRLYLGDVTGFLIYILLLLTCGIGNFIFWIIDLCLIPKLVDDANFKTSSIIYQNSPQVIYRSTPVVVQPVYQTYQQI